MSPPPMQLSWDPLLSDFLLIRIVPLTCFGFSHFLLIHQGDDAAHSRIRVCPLTYGHRRVIFLLNLIAFLSSLPPLILIIPCPAFGNCEHSYLLHMRIYKYPSLHFTKEIEEEKQKLSTGFLALSALIDSLTLVYSLMRRRLLPGLPDDIARECLIRVPYRWFPTARSVCRRWKRELDSPYFHRIRKAAGLTRPVVAFTQAESAPATGSSAVKSVGGSTPSYRLSLFEPATGAWSLLPPVPGLPHGQPFFSRIAAAERELVVVGGWDPKTWAASDGVHVYDFATGSWRRGAPMPGPRRSFFACATASVGGRVAVVVAGGHDEEKNALRSAMAYDVASDTWAPLPDMATERDECRGVCLDGRFYVIGGYSTEAQGWFSRTAEALDLAAGQWGAVEEEKLDEGTCPRTCVVGGDGRLYMCRGDQGGQLAVLDAAGWRAVAEVPGDARVSPELVAWDGCLLLMGSETHGGAQTGYIMEAGTATWKKVEVPEEYSGNIHASCCLEI